MDMISKTIDNIPIIILPIVDRAAEDVVVDPAFHNTESGALINTISKTENAGDIIKCFDTEKKLSSSVTTNINSIYKFFEWQRVSKTSVEGFTKFFSPFCNSICTSEAKLSMANHFSLWDDLASTNSMKTVHHDKYVVVVENDISMLNVPILYTLIESMKNHNIDILQLREALYSGGNRDILSSEPALYSYKGAYDISLSCYIIKIATMLKYIEEIKKIGGISTGLYFEMSKIEQDVEINRHILNDASEYVKHEPRFLSNKRISNMRNGLWNRVGNWLSKRFPDITYLLTMPLFSFFNLFDVTLLGVLIIIYIFILIIFNVSSKLMWFSAGTAFTYVI
ncbi:IMV heparin-binding surface protein [Eptesipox virus]|uniref:IMV heparin-binding surface protein n=1 Tax=Eptesipox virus TaxID=1329402 RepID=A0A220T6D9_9POXV|nr:IMV heparin-binding surface protein [Eptesipox virus]ASK51279.1 IMV heparin-binding surface protein [Eptesipox virus]WAH71037.1 IMV heparin-binding surface protein [Eptesipox virus]